MLNKQQNKIIFWDIGNVLVKFFEKEFKDKLLKNKKDNLSDDDFLEQYQNIINNSFLGLISLAKTWNKIFNLTSISHDEIAIMKKEFKTSINEELLRFIKDDLKDCRVGIISDLHQIAYRLVSNYHPSIFKIFNSEFVYLSNKVGRSKAVHGIKHFQYIFESVGKDKYTIFYIDDEPDKLEMARRCGAKTILFSGISKKECCWWQSNEQLIRELKKNIK